MDASEPVRGTAATRRPVFVHAGWRTGSTYVWSRFRERPEYCCYLEPLHEAFVDTPVEQFEREFAGQITATLRHPTLSRHYFTEYPFRPQGGVEKFRKHFPYQAYCLDEQSEDPALEEYIGHLLGRAAARGCRPVLQFNRGLLRSRWLQRRFHSIDILLVRRPLDVWRSYCSFPHRYFITVTALLAGQNREHPWFRPLQEVVPVPHYVDSSVRKEYEYYYQFTDTDPARLYALFYYFQALTFLYNLGSAHLLMDIDALSASAEAREALHGRLGELGLRATFHDCRSPRSAAQDGLAESRRREIEKEVVDLIYSAFGKVLEPASEGARAQLRWLGEDFQPLLDRFSSLWRPRERTEPPAVVAPFAARRF